MLLQMLWPYSVAALLFCISILFTVAYIKGKNTTKYRGYQGQIAKNHSRILKLEVQNQQLELQIAKLQSFITS